MKYSHPNILSGLLLASLGSAASADPYFTGNPYSPYPPGCATQMLREVDHYAEYGHRFFDGSVLLDVARRIDSTDPADKVAEARMELFRFACAEPGRSLILVKFRLGELVFPIEPGEEQFVLPTFAGQLVGEELVPFELKSEPNTWSARTQQAPFTRHAFGDFFTWESPDLFTWWYVLDLGSAASAHRAADLATRFNEAFELMVFREQGLALQVNVPATRDVLGPNSPLPLNGRLSGNWVEKDTRDQGLLISFATRMPQSGAAANRPEDSDLVIFLSWFTFDAEGRHLWLTGAAQFAQGVSEVQVPIERVNGGTFMGAAPAQRSVIGSARLRALGCNDLELEYDLADIGLGQMRLERLYSLEIAGHPCRDYWARVATADPQSTDPQ